MNDWIRTHVPDSNVGWANVGPTSGRQYRRWANVGPTFIAVRGFAWFEPHNYIVNLWTMQTGSLAERDTRRLIRRSDVTWVLMRLKSPPTWLVFQLAQINNMESANVSLHWPFARKMQHMGPEMRKTFSCHDVISYGIFCPMTHGWYIFCCPSNHWYEIWYM